MLQEATIQASTGNRQVADFAPQFEAVSKRERTQREPSRGAQSLAEHFESKQPAAAERNSRARLSFDPEKHRVFVEIIDPKTGDVVTRFPPEQIAIHIDEVLEQTDQQTNLQESGLIVDRTV